MMGWLKRAKTADIPAETKSSTFVDGGLVRRPASQYSSTWTVDRAVNDALKKVTWVYRCVDAIASNAARIPMLVRVGDAWDGEEQVDNELLRVLNSKSNVGESSYTFRWRLSAQLLLSEKGAFIEVTRDRGGRVTSLSLLPPQYITPVPDQKNFIKVFKLDMPIQDDNGNVKQLKKDLKPENVIWIRKPHPFDPYSAMTPLSSIGLAIETDWYAKVYNRNFLMNDGRPGGMVVIKGDATEEDKEELKARFRGNPATAGRITVISSEEGADFVDTAITPRDAQYVDTRRITKEEILMGFGVPESVLSNAAGRTFDNAEIERLIFWQETMLPHLDLITRDLDALDEDENTYIGVDLSRVDVLLRADIKRMDFIRMLFEDGLISVDEARTEMGRPETGDEGGHILFRQNTHLPYAMDNGEDIPDIPGQVGDARSEIVFDRQEAAMEAQVQAAQAEQQQPNMGRPSDSGKPKPAAEEPKKPREGDQRKPGAPIPKKEMPSDTLEFLEDWENQLAKSELTTELTRWEAVMNTTLKRFFERQERVVVDKLKGQKMRSLLGRRYKMIKENGPFSGDISDSALTLKAAVDTVYDGKTWNHQLAEDIQPIIEGIVKEFAEAVAADFDPNSYPAKTLVQNHMDRVLEVNAETKQSIESTIAAGVMAEETPEVISKRIAPVFEAFALKQVEILSQMEVAAAAAGGTYLGGMQAGKTTKVWIPLDEESVRPGNLDSKVSIRDKFVIGDAKVLYPGDPSASYWPSAGNRCGLRVE